MRRTAVFLAAGLALVMAAPAVASPSWGGNPKGILVSDVTGSLKLLDLRTGEITAPLYEFDDFGNFDIQYVSPSEIVIANAVQGRVDRLDLVTGVLVTVVSDGLVSPMGIAVSPRGDHYYIADYAGAVYAYDVGSGALSLLADEGPDGELLESPDGVVLDRRGRVILTTQTGKVYRIEPASGDIELLASIGVALSGGVLTPQGDLVAAAFDSADEGSPGGLYRVDPDGNVTVLYEGLPLRDPEDVLVTARGDVYVVDSDFRGAFGSRNPAVYLLRRGATIVETLASAQQGDPISGDPVDMLFVRPGGWR